MGIWGAFSSAAGALRDQLPDPEPVKDAGLAACSKVGRGASGLRATIAGVLSSSYDCGRSALSAAARAKESVPVPDKEVLAKIGRAVTDVALDTYSRTYTAGIPVYRIVVEGLGKDGATKASEKKMKAEELEEMRRRVERIEAMLLAQHLSTPAHPHRRQHVNNGRPEDVIHWWQFCP